MYERENAIESGTSRYYFQSLSRTATLKLSKVFDHCELDAFLRPFFSRRCSSFQANAFVAEFHGRARGRLPSTTVVVVLLVERSSTFAPRVGTLRWKRSSKTGPQLTISPWDRASAKLPRIKLGFSINEKTFQPENNSRIDTRSYPVHRRSYFLSKKKSSQPLSRHTPRLSFPLSLYRSVIVNRVTRGTAGIGKMRRHCIVRVVME